MSDKRARDAHGAARDPAGGAGMTKKRDPEILSIRRIVRELGKVGDARTLARMLGYVCAHMIAAQPAELREGMAADIRSWLAPRYWA